MPWMLMTLIVTGVCVCVLRVCCSVLQYVCCSVLQCVDAQRDTTHSHVWHDTFTRVICRIHMRHMTHSYMWHA